MQKRLWPIRVAVFSLFIAIFLVGGIFITGDRMGERIGNFVPSAAAQSIKLPRFDGFSSLPGSQGNDGLRRFITSQLFPVFRTLFSVIAVLYIIYYGALLVFSFGAENDIKTYRNALFYAVVGLFVINLGDPFNKAFNPQENLGELDILAANRLAGSIIDVLRLFAVPVTVALLLISGYRLATNLSNEAEAGKARTQILYTILGLIIINMAETAILFVSSADPQVGNAILTSFTNLVLLFVVPIGFIMLAYGGISILFSFGNQARYDRGLKIIKGTAIAMVIIYSAFTIVTEVAKWIVF